MPLVGADPRWASVLLTLPSQDCHPLSRPHLHLLSLCLSLGGSLLRWRAILVPTAQLSVAVNLLPSVAGHGCACVQTRVCLGGIAPHPPGHRCNCTETKASFPLLRPQKKAGEVPIIPFTSGGQLAARSPSLTDTQRIAAHTQVNRTQKWGPWFFPARWKNSKCQHSDFEAARNQEHETLFDKYSKESIRKHPGLT